MDKNFDLWNDRKKHMDAIIQRPMFKERDVWWCSFGINIGDEQNGKGQKFVRPVLVIKKFNKNIFLGIPLSTKIKESVFYYKIHFKGIEQSIVLSQIRLMDARRFGDHMGSIPNHEMIKIKEQLKKLIL